MVPLTMNALALSRAELSVHPKVIDTFWYVKLMEFLGQLNRAKELILFCKLKAIIIPQELRQSLIPPALRANHLTLKLQEPSSHTIVESVDRVLWMFSHLDSISMKYGFDISFKFVYEKQLATEENLYWRHSLKEVKIEGAEDVWNLKKFFFDNAKNLEKVDVIA